ncbi:MAG: endopeptidase La [Desulfobacteraceae bacterium]|nr:endopeptidase La [Desulfobacteraceae bacterium]
MAEKDSIIPELVNDEGENPAKEQAGTLALPQQLLPDKLCLLPMPERPFFPAQAQPIMVNIDPWVETLKRVRDSGQTVIGLCYVENFGENGFDAGAFPEIGCVVQLHQVQEVEDKLQFLAQGLKRFKITKWISTRPPFMATVSYPKSPEEDQERLKAYSISVIKAIKTLLPLNPLYNEELKQYLSRFTPNDPSLLSDFAATITSATGKELQGILETLSLSKRMDKVLVMLKKELEILKMQKEISQEVNRKVSENQRKFFLKEQLKVIQEELGLSKDDKTAEIEKFTNRLKKMEVPEHVQEEIDDEFEKIRVLETGSAEYGVTRNYLDWLTSIPWGVYSTDNLDLDIAKKILERDHDALDDVKDRIIEFLAVGAYKKEIAGSILLLVGPPGVGKTSIGKSIAESLGRKFFRFSLGGMRDEAEIKGHRRTYIGALPGKLVHALKDCKVSNPVIMLDEIDKIGISYQGDPASALLEVLDPEQNDKFLDHYLDLTLDLSKVLFICTANQLDTIPGPLFDRMDAIRLSGYITKEKVDIAKHHLWPRLLKRSGLKSKQLKITDATIRQIVEGYAREAGVRNLEKHLARIVRKSIVKLLKKPDLEQKVSLKNLEELLGKPVFQKERSITGVGVVTGLAWTSLGGATLSIEAARIDAKQKGFKLTGQLGDVMQESASIAYSYISSNMTRFKGNTDYFDTSFIHIHVPEGATPKDGPSAGITMATALLSLAFEKKIDRPLAMTGELTLTGQVLPVGGIREKIIAARRIKIMELILPYANQRDFDELPDHIKSGITVHFAKNYKDVAKVIF